MTGLARVSVFLLLILQGTSLAQVYPFKHYTTANGLVQATVEKIFQDSRGFLWFGTRDGVSRYDGNSFTSFLHSGAIRSDVKYMWEDDEHTLWFVTFGNGVAKLKQSDTTFLWLKAADGVLPDDYVNVVYRDRQGRMWIGTMSGLVVVRTDGSSQKLDKNSGLPHNVIHTIKEDREGYVWLGTNGGVVRGRLTQDMHFDSELVLTTPTRTLCLTRDGDMLAATTSVRGDTEGRIVRFLKGSPTRYGTITIREPFKGMTIFEDSRGYVWVGSTRGIFLLFKGTMRRILGANGLENEYVYDIMEDREGTLWIGTQNGVAKLPARRLVTYGVTRGSSSDIVLCMFQDSKRNLWYGTYEGLVVIRPDERVTMFREHDGLHHRLVNAIAEDPDGGVWIGTRGGLSVLRNGKLTSMSIEGLREGRSVASIVRDTDGSMWLGCIGRIIRVSRQGEEDIIGIAQGVPQDAIRSLVFDRTGTLWFATDEHGAGFCRGEKITMLTTRDGLPDNRVTSVYPDHTGKVWFTTHTGIAVLDKGAIRDLPEPSSQRGLVYFVMVDSSGQMWCGTRYGVFVLRADPVLHLSTRDGLAADQVEHGLVDAHGNIWFGTNAGVSRLDRVLIRQRIPLPPTSLVRIVAGDNDREAVNESLFPYAENTLTFHFNALSFVDETAIRFQWMLEGFDRDFQSPQTQRLVRYTNLSPGSYRFVVRAANRNGLWSPPDFFVFSIEPPFWQTPWFIALVFLTIGFLLALAYRYRVNHLLHIERMRTRIAADLHDDIASSLSSVALYSDVIQRQLSNVPDESRELLDRIRGLSRETMEKIGLIVWSVDPRRDEAGEVVTFFQRHAVQMCTAAGIAFDSSGLDAHTSLVLTPEQRRAVYLILKEGLNNIIRHAACSKVSFRCSVEDRTLRVVLADDGRGFDVAQRGHGHGLQNMRSRAESIGARLGFSSTPGEGTSLDLSLRIA